MSNSRDANVNREDASGPVAVRLLETVGRTVSERGLLAEGSPVVLMVSGGSDSTALACLFAQLRDRGQTGPLAMLHVNHGLRGEAAAADQDFAARLAAQLDIPFFCCEVDVALLAKTQGGNVEAIGRQERYAAAKEALESLCLHMALPLSSGRIATAHTQDDRVESFYMRSIKGTGPGGFRSMLYCNGPVVRPLLDVSREELRAYLEERSAQGLPTTRSVDGALWCEDATNAHTDRFRAYVRHELVPLAKAKNAALLDTLCRTMNLIGDEDDFMDRLAADAVAEDVEWVYDSSDESRPDAALLRPSFASLDVALARRAVRQVLLGLLCQDARLDSAQVEGVLEAFDGGAPKSGYVGNVAGDLAVSANKGGVLVEPMARFRTRRKRA